MKRLGTLVLLALRFLMPLACGGSQDPAESPEDAAAREAAPEVEVRGSEDALLEQMQEENAEENLDEELSEEGAPQQARAPAEE